MANRSGIDGSAGERSRTTGSSASSRRWLLRLGWLGVLLAAPFFLWTPLALVTSLPSLVDVFGVAGIRIPASVTVAGLLFAAIGFHRF